MEQLDDDDIEVDVEECSDGEASSRAAKSSNKVLRQSPAISECGSDPPDNDRESPDLVPEKPHSKTPKVRCNCDELLNVECHLETKELWDKFHDLGTEMIITKTGRSVINLNNILRLNILNDGRVERLISQICNYQKSSKRT